MEEGTFFPFSRPMIGLEVSTSRKAFSFSPHDKKSLCVVDCAPLRRQRVVVLSSTLFGSTYNTVYIWCLLLSQYWDVCCSLSPYIYRLVLGGDDPASRVSP